MTWSRDSHGLFDYESRYINKKNIKSLQPGRIVRIEDDVEFLPNDVPLNTFSPDAKPLLTLMKSEGGKFKVLNDTQMPDDTQTEQNKMYVVVRNVKGKQGTQESAQTTADTEKYDYRINKGDIIKMGRLKFLVRDFRSEHTAAKVDSNGDSPIKRSFRAQD